MSLPSPFASGLRAGLAVAGVCVLAPAIASAATYYVDPAGDDAAAGDESAPWQTLEHAAHKLVAGDQLVVREGRYRGFELRARGTEEATSAYPRTARPSAQARPKSWTSTSTCSDPRATPRPRRTSAPSPQAPAVARLAIRCLKPA
jgi:hypothetical protein